MLACGFHVLLQLLLCCVCSFCCRRSEEGSCSVFAANLTPPQGAYLLHTVNALTNWARNTYENWWWLSLLAGTCACAHAWESDSTVSIWWIVRSHKPKGYCSRASCARNREAAHAFSCHEVSAACACHSSTRCHAKRAASTCRSLCRNACDFCCCA
jgi:hypothetical protein